MDFYNQLLSRKLGGGGGDPNATFKSYVNGDLTVITADMLDGATTIMASAFSNYTSLVSIDIPNSVTTIGNSAFYYCTSLTNIDFPDSLRSIEYNAFYNCSSLTSVDISGFVTSIGGAAFYNCTSLETVTILNGFRSLNGYNTFANCTSLKNVMFPSSITYIGYEFSGCKALINVTVEAISPPALGNNSVFDGATNLVIYVPADSVNAYKSAQYWSKYADRIQAIPS